MKRVVITGGGTGGHVYPALAVAEALKQDPEIEDILYIGNIGKTEANLIPQHGFRFEGLSFSGMPRGLNLRIFPWAGSLVTSMFRARQILHRFQPDVAFGTGGYVTGPVLMAARSLNIPYVIHEPDAHPGLVNRVTAQWASAVTCAFADAQKALKNNNIIVTGNPLRSGIGLLNKAEGLARLNLPFTPEKPVLLITGGSQGARKINQGVLEALPQLIDDLGYQVIHQTGEKLYAEVRQQCPASYLDNPYYYFAPFIKDMAATLAVADIAICRSGSMTLSEMYQAHIPTILVPYPFAAADHQRKNALASQNAGASRMILDSDFSGASLLTLLTELNASPSQLQTMAHAAETLATPHATRDVIQVIRHASTRR